MVATLTELQIAAAGIGKRRRFRTEGGPSLADPRHRRRTEFLDYTTDKERISRVSLFQLARTCAGKIDSKLPSLAVAWGIMRVYKHQMERPSRGVAAWRG
jgi:hypothetical protein